MKSLLHRPSRRLAVLALAIPAGVALAAAPAAAQTAGNPPQFATGVVSSVHGTSVQVENQTQNSESTVVLGASTAYEKTETVAASAIAAGTCVRVTGTGTTAKGITATSVSVSQPTNGSCTQGRGANGVLGGNGGGLANGSRPNFGSGSRPDFGNGSRPNFGANGTRPANFAAAFGPVVSISGETMTVKATIVTPPKGSTAKSAKKTSTKKGATTTTRPRLTTTTKNVKIKLTSSTTITQTVTATAADVAVGACVTAVGQTASGAVDASNVTISAPVNGTCSAGAGRFGGFGGFGGRGFGGAGGSTGGSGTST